MLKKHVFNLDLQNYNYIFFLAIIMFYEFLYIFKYVSYMYHNLYIFKIIISPYRICIVSNTRIYLCIIEWD